MRQCDSGRQIAAACIMGRLFAARLNELEVKRNCLDAAAAIIEDGYQRASGGSATMVDVYAAKEGLPVALYSSVTPFKKTALKRKQKKIMYRRSADQLRVA